MHPECHRSAAAALRVPRSCRIAQGIAQIPVTVQIGDGLVTAVRFTRGRNIDYVGVSRAIAPAASSSRRSPPNRRSTNGWRRQSDRGATSWRRLRIADTWERRARDREAVGLEPRGPPERSAPDSRRPGRGVVQRRPTGEPRSLGGAEDLVGARHAVRGGFEDERAGGAARPAALEARHVVGPVLDRATAGTPESHVLPRIDRLTHRADRTPALRRPRPLAADRSPIEPAPDWRGSALVAFRRCRPGLCTATQALCHRPASPRAGWSPASGGGRSRQSSGPGSRPCPSVATSTV